MKKGETHMKYLLLLHIHYISISTDGTIKIEILVNTDFSCLFRHNQ